MIYFTTKNKAGRILSKCLALLFWVLVWQVVYIRVGRDILVASPVQVVKRLVVLSGDASFWSIIGNSCLRILAGFLIAAAAGCLLAAAAHWIPATAGLTRPLMTVIKATPVTSFILLALIWITTNRLPVFIACLMVMPLVFENIYQGLRKVDPQLLEMARIFRLSFGKQLRAIYLPSVRPCFLAACSTGLGFAWKAGIAAEVLARPGNSIGTQIYNAKIYLETVDIFAWTMVIILLSLFIEKVLIALLKTAMGSSSQGAETDGN